MQLKEDDVLSYEVPEEAKTLMDAPTHILEVSNVASEECVYCFERE